ncbi:MAG: protein kinase, partial [Deltaproteobacteria bacterium]|nr:protein kinase [Deltaproteobacteria bacterium]
EAPIARGGMAEVWRGRHVEEDVPVAVKVLTADVARKAEYRAAFRTEVRAVAWLDHPGIVVVLDHGEVPEETAARSSGQLAAGSPYLVMELATLGTLRRIRAPLRWSELRVVILSLLDACAHAHARGVIHRDLKPGNVLVTLGAGPSTTGLGAGPDVRLKLTDFGIAHVEPYTSSTIPEPLRAFGTPGFMAPEQLRGATRDVGPWTDLYALGSLAFVLACGRAPFGTKPEEAAEAQLGAKTPPPFDPVHPHPPELAAWVARCLARDPEHRFERAADAAFALPRDLAPTPAPTRAQNLSAPHPASPRGAGRGDARRWARASSGPGPLSPNGERVGVRGERSADSSPPPAPFWVELVAAEHRRASPTEAATPDAQTLPAPTDATLTVPFHALADLSDRPPSSVPSPPPVPESWRHANAPRPSMRLVGAGLRLFPLRATPMVGRRSERDRLWAELRDVVDRGLPRAVVVAGSAGVGKSRLAEWIAERAHEVGAATVLRASHGPTADPGDALARMWIAFLRAQGLPADRVTERARRALERAGSREPAEWRALADVATGARFESAAERHLASIRALSRLAIRRAVLVWLDDVQWGADSLELVSHALDASGATRVLFVLTAQDEALAERSHEASLVASLVAKERATSLAVAPLRPRDASSLVSDLLRLEPRLAQRVVARARGNPLFAVQLVGDWVQRGALRVGPVGFELAGDARAHVPDDLYAVWAARIERNLATRPAGDARALEVAAVLGHEVDRAEWREACAEAGAVPDDGFEDALVASRFVVVPHERGFSFVHGMLRETIERGARDGGALLNIHAAIARALSARPRAGDVRVAERLGRHLLEAGDPAGAWSHLMDGAEQRRERCDYAGAHDALDAASQALERIGAPESDVRLGELWLARSWVARLTAAYDEAQRLAERTLEAARTHGWPALEAEAEARLGEVSLRRGDVRTAEARIERAMVGLVREGRFVSVARARWTLGWVKLLRGDPASAIELFESVLRVTVGAKGAAGPTLHAMWSLGHALARHGDLDRAEETHEEAMRGAEEHQNLLARAHAHHGLLTVARLRGDLARAERHAREALAGYAAVGSGETYAPRYGLGLAYLDAGRFDDARAELERGLVEVDAARRFGLQTLFLVPSLVCAAREAELASFDRLVERAGDAIERSGIADVELVAVASRAAAILDAR